LIHPFRASFKHQDKQHAGFHIKDITAAPVLKADNNLATNGAHGNPTQQSSV
jgi:hypothetical protein